MPTILRSLPSLFSSLCLMVLLLVGCSKTAEGEQKAWTGNVQTVNELIATYPGFKPALEARLASATQTFDAAASLSGDEQVAKMAEANSALMQGFVRDLKGIERRMKELREKRVQAAAQAGDESTRLGAKLAAEDAQKALDRAQAALEEGAGDESSANAILAKVTADLKTAQSTIDKVLEADRSKKAEAEAKDEAAAEADAKAKADAEAKVAPWTCEYCESQNPHDATKCSSCGAPRAEQK